MMKISPLLLCVVLVTACSPTSKGVTNSRWRLVNTSQGDGGIKGYDIVFHPDGKLEVQQPNEKTPNNDFWKQKGAEIILTQNDGYAVYEGRLIDENTMSGTAKNKVGKSWKWRATIE